MVLVLLAVVGTTLGVTARRLAQRAAELTAQEQALQDEWAWRSARALVLPKAEALLLDAEAQASVPVRHVPLSLTLNSRGVLLIVSDEQAKPHLQSMINRDGPHETTRHLGLETSGRRLPPRPTEPLAQVKGIAGSWMLAYAQVFPDDRPQTLWDQAFSSTGSAGPVSAAHNVGALDAAPVSRFTLWGNGKLGFRRCTAEALASVTRPLLDRADVAELIALRERQPGVSFDAALAQIGREDGGGRLLQERVQDQSQAHALWMIWPKPGQAAARMAVRWEGANKQLTTTLRW